MTHLYRGDQLRVVRTFHIEEHFGPPAHLAVGETVILLTSPLQSTVKRLLKEEGGAAE